MGLECVEIIVDLCIPLNKYHILLVVLGMVTSEDEVIVYIN